MKKLIVLFLSLTIAFASFAVLPISAKSKEPEWKSLYSDLLTKYLNNRYKYGLDYNNEMELEDYTGEPYYRTKKAPFAFLYDFNFDGTPELVCGVGYEVLEYWDGSGKIDKIYTISDSKVVLMGTPNAATDPFSVNNGIKRYFDMETRKIRYFVTTSYYNTLCVDELIFDFSKNKVKKVDFANISHLEDDQGTHAEIDGKKITSQSYYRQKIYTLFNERFIRYSDLNDRELSKEFYDFNADESEYIENGYDSIEKSVLRKYADDVISLYQKKVYTNKITSNYSDYSKFYINSYLDEKYFNFYRESKKITKSATTDDNVILFSGNEKILKRIDACRLKAVGIGKTKVTVYSPNNKYKKTFEVTVHPYVPNVKLIKATKNSLTLKIGSVPKGVKVELSFRRALMSEKKIVATSGGKTVTLKNLKANWTYVFKTEIEYQIGDKKYSNIDTYSFETKKKK